MNVKRCGEERKKERRDQREIPSERPMVPLKYPAAKLSDGIERERKQDVKG